MVRERGRDRVRDNGERKEVKEKSEKREGREAPRSFVVGIQATPTSCPAHTL